MNIAVIFAGGSGKRMNSGDIPKQFLEIEGKPIIIYTLEHFQDNSNIDAIVIACKEDWIAKLHELIEEYKITKVRNIVPGGTTGQLSIYNGLKAAESIDRNSIVLIHDGVRPLITDQLINENIRSVEKNGSAVTTSVVTETILVVNDKEEIEEVPDRTRSRVAKAPQSFRLADVLRAHEAALKEGRTDFIDTCTMMKHYGHKLFLVDGPYENIKITTPDDYHICKILLGVSERSDECQD